MPGFVVEGHIYNMQHVDHTIKHTNSGERERSCCGQNTPFLHHV